jgi:hypothetical protein
MAGYASPVRPDQFRGIRVTVFASNVTITNCVISVGGKDAFPVAIQTDRNNEGNPITSFTIKNCTVSGSDNNMNLAAACIKDIYGNCAGTLVQTSTCIGLQTVFRFTQANCSTTTFTTSWITCPMVRP